MNGTFWGKLIGFGLGFLVLGPFGALIGLFIGAAFDRGLRLNLYQRPSAAQFALQHHFIDATFLLMGYIAKSDGRVSQQELQVARLIMSQLGLNEIQTSEAMRSYNQGKELSQEELSRLLTKLKIDCQQDMNLLSYFMEIQLIAAFAEGQVSQEKLQLLRNVSQKIDLPYTRFERLWEEQQARQAFQAFYTFYEQAAHQAGSNQRYYQEQRYYRGQQGTHNPNALQDAYQLLGIPTTASPAEIKTAYRRLMNQHHPDKLTARGLSEKMVQMAKEKTQQIRAAYDLIRAAKGFK
ncbi:MAG: DnaJ-like protein DjlA [Pseudomonadota bacterium]|jgi:DnaJ like chaperone protein